MSAFIGPALLRKLVAEKSGIAVETVDKVLAAYGEAVVSLVEGGANVRVLERGYFTQIKTKASRRKSPMVKGFVKVPARRKIVFRESRKK